MVSTLLAGSVLLGCVWIYPESPATTPPECRGFSALPASITLVDEAHGVTLEESMRAEAEPLLRTQLFKPDPDVDRAFQLWSMRNVAYHLDRAIEFTKTELKRNVQWRDLHVSLGNRTIGMSTLSDGKIRLGGAHALTSEVIYHELGHHLVEWENPGVTATRGTRDQNSAGYSIIEAYANHFAFVFDDEPRYAEYNQVRFGGNAKYSYTVKTTCSLKSCEDLPSDVRPHFLHVVVFGALLWDLKEVMGGAASLNLMLDSVRLLDVKSQLTHRSAVIALLGADKKKFGGRNAAFIKARARERLGENMR